MNPRSKSVGPREARVYLLLALLLSLAACSEESSGDGTSHAKAARPDSPAAFRCPERPIAHVLARDDGEFARLSKDLTTAGFEVASLPLERSPKELHGLVFIATGASRRADYAAYMDSFGSDLYHFVDRANVLVQMSQDPGQEASPPFLPTTQEAHRSESAVSGVDVLQADAVLLRDVPLDRLDGEDLETTAASFESHSGFAVLARPSDADGSALLLEGAYGQGRIVLSALPLDGPELTLREPALGAAFFENLARETRSVCARDSEALVIEQGRFSDRLTAGSQSLALLPDTQVYALRVPGLFLLQTAWLVEQAPSLDLRYVLHLGDIVNNNTETEWERASEAMSLLHGYVSYALVPGNHDYGPSGDASTRETLLNDHFDFDALARVDGFGGAYEAGKLDNTYHLFEIAGRSFVLVALEWGPRDAVIEWANTVMDEYPEREGILLTHAYLNNDDRRYDHADEERSQPYNPHDYATPGGVNDGEQLWQKLVRKHRFALTINGHVLGDGTGYLRSTTDHGNTCHQMLVNYQMREQGGQAYLRLLEFLPDGETVRVHSYSPLLGTFLDETDQRFEFVLD